MRPHPSHTALNSAQLPRCPPADSPIPQHTVLNGRHWGSQVVSSNPAVPTSAEAR